MTPPPRRVVVIGGGFGGLEVCKRLACANKRGEIALTLIDKENFFQFNPLMPEVAVGAVETRHIVYPLRKFCRPRRIRFLRNKVRSIDSDKRILHLHNDIDVEWDELVVAVGATTNFFRIPGAVEHSFVFKTLMDAIRLRAHVIEMWELADQATDPAVRRRLLIFAVAGGGITGVEVCSELTHMFRTTMARLYTNVPQSLVNVQLIEAADRLLPGLSQSHSRVAEQHLRSIGVNVVLNRKIVRVEDDRVHTDDGAITPANTLIWTTGVRGQELESPWPWPVGRGGRLRVDEHCRVAPGVWAIGDVAGDTPQVAQSAIQMGRVVAANVLAEKKNEPLATFHYKDIGYFVGLGKHSTLAQVGGIPIAGWFAFYLWALVYMVKMVGFQKQLEVAFDMIKMFFVDHDTSEIHDRRRMLRPQDLEPDLTG